MPRFAPISCNPTIALGELPDWLSDRSIAPYYHVAKPHSRMDHQRRFIPIGT
jgi:hypothetical protein